MFTGIIQALGQIRGMQARDGDLRMIVAAGRLDLADVGLGDSIAVSGACLTVVEVQRDAFAVDVSRETLDKTILGRLQVAAMGKTHAHDLVTRLEHGQVNSLIGLRAGMSLDIGMFSAKKLQRTVHGELLGDIYVLAAAIVAFTRIAFCVFVGQHRALRGHYHGAGIVLGSDEFDMILLAPSFFAHGIPKHGIKISDGQGFGKHGRTPWASEKAGVNTNGCTRSPQG